MPRSTHIYLVTSLAGSPIAAFTVKHELVSWWRRERPDACLAWRLRDGGERGATRIEVPDA